MKTISSSELLALKGMKMYVSTSKINEETGTFTENYMIEGLGYKVQRKLGDSMFDLFIKISKQHLTMATFESWQDGLHVMVSPLMLTTTEGPASVLEFIRNSEETVHARTLHKFNNETEAIREYGFYTGFSNLEMDAIVKELFTGDHNHPYKALRLKKVLRSRI